MRSFAVLILIYANADVKLLLHLNVDLTIILDFISSIKNYLVLRHQKALRYMGKL